MVVRMLVLFFLGCSSQSDGDSSLPRRAGDTSQSTPDIVDEDGDGHAPVSERGDDCNDADPTVHPGAPDGCNGIDNDCDGITDEAGNPWYFDEDGDGYGLSDADPVLDCDPPRGYAPMAGDCDDGNSAIHPSAEEADCTDPVDYNCDGVVAYADADGDGSPACLDCEDMHSSIHPGGDEHCDGVDENCNDRIDEDPIDGQTWYGDSDGDGWGSQYSPTQSCEQPDGFVWNQDDCNDADPSVNPMEDEWCDDGVDSDCHDGDNNDFSSNPAMDATFMCMDYDDDGHGNPAGGTLWTCSPDFARAYATSCDDACDEDPEAWTYEECVAT